MWRSEMKYSEENLYFVWRNLVAAFLNTKSIIFGILHEGYTTFLGTACQ
jgi:hypothetical protein